MTITLTVEDGSIVPGANTYAGIETAREYARNRGVELADGDDSVAVLLLKAMDYLVLYLGQWKGNLVIATQPLPWPRTDVYIVGYDEVLPDDTIPTALISAQCQLVIEQTNGIELLGSTIPGLPVIREKVDVIETEYASPADLGGLDFTQPTMPLVAALLKPLLNSGFRLHTRRV